MKQHPTLTHIKISEDGNKILSSLSGKLLKTWVNENGYALVTITLSSGVYKKYRVHRLVAETYLGIPDKVYDVHHKDHNKLNNHYSNLEWCDRAHNIREAVDCGVNPSKGETHPHSVYTEGNIREVCKLISEGLRNCDIEVITGVGRDTISKLRYGEIWSHVVKDFNLKPLARKGRISVTKIRSVCEMLENGESNVSISETVGLSKFTISKIRNRRTYQSVSKDYNF